MANANVVNAWRDDENAYLAIKVPGEMIEYIGSTPLRDAAGNPKSVATLKEELRVACQAKRNAQLTGQQPVAITGTVAV
jgi:hypothetical protein